MTSSITTVYADGTIDYVGTIGRPESFPWLSQEDLIYIDERVSSGNVSQNKPDYLVFWEALMASSTYASIREQSFVSLPMNTLATEFIALIGDAKAGRANEAAIQASMTAILTTGTFTEAQLAELGAALTAGNLDDIYSLS
jgi:hypothetical protein